MGERPIRWQCAGSSGCKHSGVQLHLGLHLGEDEHHMFGLKLGAKEG